MRSGIAGIALLAEYLMGILVKCTAKEKNEEKDDTEDTPAQRCATPWRQ